MYPRQGIPFEAYRDVILTRDLIEGGLRVGDVGTVVEPHVVAGVPEESIRSSSSIWTGNTRSSHVAGERPAPAGAS